MAVIPPEVYYLTGLYSLIIGLTSIYNFWRAPPPAGHRPLLIVSIVAFGIGVTLDGFERLQLIPDTIGAIPEIFILAGISLMLYVAHQVHTAIKERGGKTT